MNLAEYKDYLLLFTWRVGDTELTSALDQLILQAEASMNRQLVTEFLLSIPAAVVTSVSTVIPFPADCQRIAYVTASDGTPFTYVSSVEYNKLLPKAKYDFLYKFTIKGRNIILLGPVSASQPITDLVIDYYTKIPSFVAFPTESIFQQEFPDVYLAFVVYEIASYLRDAELRLEYQDKISMIVEGFDRAQASAKLGTGPLTQVIPGAR